MKIGGFQVNKPRYDVGTWDSDKGDYTPQRGVRCRNLTIHGLRRALKALRGMGYSAHYVREPNGEHYHNDSYVLVERR